MVANLDNGFVVEQVKTITGATPKLVEDYDILDITPTERLQVRIDRNNAPKAMVERFRWQMGESTFPPIVVTEDHRIIDGNTRYRARMARQEARTPVLVVPISWDGATPEMQNRLLLLGLALNNVNGQPLDESERANMVKHAILLGMTDPQIQYTIGVAGRAVKALRAQVQAERRLAQVGVELDHMDSVAPAAFRTLGADIVTELDDESFRGLAMLAKDAAFKANEVKALAVTLSELSGQDMRDERLARERETQAQRIAEVRHGEAGRPPLASQARRNLGMFMNHPIEMFVERRPDEMVEHVRVLQTARTILERVLELQAELMPTSGAAE